MATDVVTLSLLEALTQAEQERLRRIAKAWDAYHGEHPRPLRVRPGGPDDNVAVNFTKVFVLKGVAFLFGDSPTWELAEGENTEAEEYLEDVWGQRRRILLKNYALNGAVTGHPFLRIRIDRMERGRPFPRLVLLDPATVFPSWEADDVENVWRYRIQFTGLNREAKQVTFRQLIERDGSGAFWQITDQVSVGGSNTWQTVAEERWPWSFPPIVHNQNLPAPNEFWGLADLEADVVRLNFGLNAVVSNLNKILRLWSHPRTVARGLPQNQRIYVDPEGVINLPNLESDLKTLEMTSDLSGAIRFLMELRQYLHEVARVPEVATGRLENTGQLSGVALQILYEPLVEATEDKRGTYGEALAELNRRLLAIGGFGEDQDVTLHWPELLPSDPLQERQAAVIDQQLGVSTDTLLQRLGYDPDVEREKREAASADLGEGLLRNFDQGEPGA